MQTAQEIVDAIGFAVGKTTSTMDSRIDLWAIANQAGRALYSRFGWTWRSHGPVALAGVSGQDYIALPADFARALKVTAASGLTPVETVTPDRIMEYRQDLLAVSGVGVVYVSFIAWSSQVNGVAGPAPRMDLYPTPASDGEPSLLLRYERKWKELSENDPDAHPNIPDEAELALVYKGMAIVKTLLEDNPGPMEQSYEAEVSRLILEDTGRQPMFGPIRGGAGNAPIGGRGCAVPAVTDVTFGL